MNRFENKIIIITGAAGGIGASTTRRIVSEGGKVVIADYSREKADQFFCYRIEKLQRTNHLYNEGIRTDRCTGK